MHSHGGRSGEGGRSGRMASDCVRGGRDFEEWCQADAEKSGDDRIVGPHNRQGNERERETS